MSPSPAPSRSSHKRTPSHDSRSSNSFLPEPVTHTISTLYRRLTEPLTPTTADAPPHPMAPHPTNTASSSHSSLLHAPPRTASPFHPPPLAPLTLDPPWPPGPSSPRTPAGGGAAPLLTRALAEEIRLLLPPRRQLAAAWRLTYGVERDGASLATLYHRCEPHSPLQSRVGGSRGAAARDGGGFVLVVQDAAGGVFGAYLTDAPHPAPHYYGTGECFLWRATVLPAAAAGLPANLPPPPSADTTNMQRSTTIGGGGPEDGEPQSPREKSEGGSKAGGLPGTASPDRIRFKAFPYSGINDYMIFCEPDYLSVGGGDGHYGLWLDSSLERGISSQCLTFGNEALSEEGKKFDVMGVEIWSVGE